MCVCVIKSRWQHGVPCLSLSLTISFSYLSFLAGLLGCILCLHRANLSPCWSVNTGTSICGYPLKKSHLWMRLCFTSSVTHVLFVLTWMASEMCVRCPHSNYLVGRCFQDLFKTTISILLWFSTSLFVPMWCIHIEVWIQLWVSETQGVMAEVLDCYFKVSEFDILSFYWVRFWTNAFEKGTNRHASHYDLDSKTTILLQERKKFALNNPRWLICH